MEIKKSSHVTKMGFLEKRFTMTAMTDDEKDFVKEFKHMSRCVTVDRSLGDGVVSVSAMVPLPTGVEPTRIEYMGRTWVREGKQ